ncbi:hypothetical protein ACIGXM_14550 [Kitasatospora sp. NPDC052896]|uniref:hypothetical protein n=1 Tax=Kitasatospora sp. NPDC052896 TaxID=3364061 RepID=UPI0037CACED7
MRVCIADAKCGGPLLSVVIWEYRGDSSDCFYAEVCAIHAVWLSDLGYRTFAMSPWSDITRLIPRETKWEFEHDSRVTGADWTEVFEVDRSICRYGCKVYARWLSSGLAPSGQALSFRVIHSRTYGCKVG